MSRGVEASSRVKLDSQKESSPKTEPIREPNALGRGALKEEKPDSCAGAVQAPDDSRRRDSGVGGSSTTNSQGVFEVVGYPHCASRIIECA